MEDKVKFLVKFLMGFCLLFSISCGANNDNLNVKDQRYFCEFYIPGVPEENTAAGFDKMIRVENKNSKRILTFPRKQKPYLNHVDKGQVLISIYPGIRIANYHDFYAYRFHTLEKKLYTSLIYHMTPDEFERIHKVPPKKENIDKRNTDSEALQYGPKKESSDWVSYASMDNAYHNCVPISYPGYIFRSFLMIIEAILIGG